MWNFVFLAILVLAVGATAPRFLDQMARDGRSPAASQAMAARPEPASATAAYAGGRSFTVRSDRDGHFRVDGRVDGRHIAFMIDTGATLVAIPEGEAAGIGIHPASRDYTIQLNTANGRLRGAPTRLSMVEVGGLIVYDVPAVVMPDRALNVNLLGMSFLSRLRRFEVADGRLMLEQ